MKKLNALSGAMVWGNSNVYQHHANIYNFDPLKPHFYIVKLGFTVVYIIFFYFCSKRSSSNKYPQSMFWAEIWTRIPRIGCVACLKRQPFDMKKEKNTGPYNCSYPLRQSLTTNFEWKQCKKSLQKLLRGNNIFTLNFTPTTKTKLKKGHNLAKILRMITNIKLDQYFTLIYPSANFQ